MSLARLVFEYRFVKVYELGAMAVDGYFLFEVICRDCVGGVFDVFGVSVKTHRVYERIDVVG